MFSRVIHIIGAGPVGCLAAVQFARLGYQVRLFERRPDIRKTKIPAGRSINLALSLRGIYALQNMDLEKSILKNAVPMFGRLMHSLKGELSFQRYGLDDSQYINSISRAELNRQLLSVAESTPGVKVLFNQKLLNYNLKEKTLGFLDEETKKESFVLAETVVGTDGSASALRSSLQKEDLLESAEDLLDYSYKELTVPASPVGHFLMEKNALHIWPRGTHMLIALPNQEGTFTCTLFLKSKGSLSFETLSSHDRVRDFFQEYYSDVQPLIPNLEENFFSNPTGHMVTVRSSPWSFRDQVLLLGDAAHAIVPFFGQGLNCGFEDCTLLNAQLSENKNLEEVFSQFSKSRKEDADAIAQLALDNFVEMRDKVASPRFLLEKEIEKHLMKKYPEQYISRYSMVTFSRLPYRYAYKVGKIQDKILAELSENILKVDDCNWNRAEKLIASELSSVMNDLKRLGNV